MPKFFCDYCDVYLTHDSMSVRKAHNSGRNHLRNVVDYYQQIGHERAQSVIDSITSSYADAGQSANNPMLQQPPGPMGGPGFNLPPGFPPPPGGPGAPNMPAGMPPMPFGRGMPPLPPGFPPLPNGFPPGMGPPGSSASPGQAPPFPPPGGMPPFPPSGMPPFPPNGMPPSMPQGMPPGMPPNFPPPNGGPPGMQGQQRNDNR